MPCSILSDNLSSAFDVRADMSAMIAALSLIVAVALSEDVTPLVLTPRLTPMALLTSLAVSEPTVFARCAWSMSRSTGAMAGLATAWWFATNSLAWTTPTSRLLFEDRVVKPPE